MTLPTQKLPKYRIKMPSTGESVSYRPFVVKEQKVLMIAMESGEYSMVADAIKHIVHECTFNTIDVENLSVFDLTYVFLNIRAKSVGETAEPLISCDACGHQNPVVVELTKIKVKNNKNHNKKISLDNDFGIVMKYPRINPDIGDVESASNIANAPIMAVAECIDLIYKGDDVFKAKECEEKELIDFIEGLTHKQFEKIIDFFETMPKLSHTVKFKCSECEKDNSVQLEGLGDFFL